MLVFLTLLPTLLLGFKEASDIACATVKVFLVLSVS
jgi:hypothetical protein